jgi:tetratricopeptide (TPR) repeat protein
MIARDYARRAELARAGIEQLRENGDTSAEASLLLALAQVVRYDPVAPVFLYGNDRNNPQRLAALRQAEALLRPLALAENGAARYRVHLAEVLYTEGQRYTGPNGRKPLAEALALLDGLDAAIRATPAVQLARAKILSLVGVRSSAEESERYQRETLRVAEEFLARQTGSIAALRLQLDVHLERVRRHRHTPAEMDAWDAAFRLGAEINRRDPSSDDNWYACLNAGRERGYAYLHRGRIAEALASLHAVAEEGNYPLRVGVVPPVRGRRYLPGIFERIAYWEAARGNTALADQALQAAYRHPPGLDVGAGGTDLAVLFRDPILIWRLRRTALLFAGDFAGAIANGESNWTQLKILLQRPDATEPDRIAFLREVESVQEQLAEAHLSLGSYAAAEAALATPPGLKPAKAPAFTPAMRVWLALALTRQGRDEEARSALEPVLQGARERLNRGTVIFTDQEILARAYFVAALAQPATEAGRARRSSALAECERILAGMPAEARELYYQRLLRRWIAEERARLPG